MAARKPEDEDIQPFFQLQKSQVLHEAKAFNDSPLDSRKCCSVLTELLCLLSQGETLAGEEATTLFFGVTKLFQSQDPMLRRLVYLIIKDLNQNQDEAFIVISSLEKDINGSIDLFRANAMRVHSKVIDASMLEQRARLFRQAIVNPNEHIASSALTAGIRMFDSNPEVIRRWVNEVRETTNSNKKMVSFHGLNLLYKIHESDRRAVMRLVTSMINKPPDSAFARCLLIRYAFSCLGNEPPKQLLAFIKDSIKQYKSPMVMFEAAKALCHVPNVAQSDLALAVTVMQEFLNSPRIVQRFASVRALSAIVSKHPNLLTASCTVDLEHLITDPNRNIATLAITTLLNTTAEYSIERLLNSITDFMTEIADELKIVLIDAIRNVCNKYPKKYEPLLTFLSMALREEGGYFYKNKIVDCMLILMNSLERARDFGLDNLCEFIEDCEYPSLSVRILNLIGQLGTKTNSPSRYIRFIYNRMLLELPSVRAGAVTCLTTFACECPYLRNDVRSLLQTSLTDEDDEVRDRATIFSKFLDSFVVSDAASGTTSAEKKQDEDDDDDIVTTGLGIDDNDENDGKEDTSDKSLRVPPPNMVGLIKVPKFDFDIADLQASLEQYLEMNLESEIGGADEDGASKEFTQEFDIKLVYENKEARLAGVATKAMKEKLDRERAAKGGLSQRAAQAGASQQRSVYKTQIELEDSSNEEYLQFLRQHSKDVPKLGDEIVTSDAVLLTEPEAEYQVELIKHIYSKHIVLQYNIQSLMEGQILNDIYVDLQDLDNEFFNISCGVLNYNDVGIAVTVIDREFDDDNNNNPILFDGKFPATLIFITKDATENAEFEEGYEDQYVLMDIEFSFKDWMMNIKDKKKKKYVKTCELKNVRMSDIKRMWNEFAPSSSPSQKSSGGKNKRASEIQRQGFVPMKKGSDNVEYRDAIEYIMNKTKLQSISEVFDIDETQDRLGWTLYNCTIDDTPYIMRCVLEKDKSNVTYKMKLRPPTNQFSRQIRDSL